MGCNDKCVKDAPEHFGLTQIAELCEHGLSYEFNFLIVWKHTDERLFWAKDSGCSCPVPFERYNSLESLNPITHANFHDFEKEINDFPVSSEEKHAVLVQVRDLLKP